jgi:hypothetical protein
MIKPVAKLTLNKEDSSTEYTISLEILGNVVYTRINPEMKDKRVEHIIKGIAGDATLGYSIYRMDDELVDHAKAYLLRRLNMAVKDEPLFQQYKVQVEEIVGGE